MRALTKKMFRGINRSRSQNIAVMAVVMCGTACYICLASLHKNLELTRDTYYAQNRFADFEIRLERAPSTTLFEIQEIPGVRQVRGRIVEDVKLDIEGVEEARSGRLVSVPDTGGNFLNSVVVRTGNFFEPGSQDEVILSEQFALANNLVIGDTIDVTADGKKHTLKIIGLGLSPEYVYIIRNIQELVPSPDRFGILWVTDDFAESALSMEAAYNSIIGSVENEDQLDAILDSAENRLDTYGIFAKTKRENQLSNRLLSDEIKNLGVVSKVIPTIFLGIASLVILILLNRMVRNERTQIGLMKAYGYTNVSVAMHYLQFALILSITGCFFGFLLGQYFALKMIELYVQFFSFPILRSQIYPNVLAQAMSITIVFSMIGAMLAAYRASQINPAESMRPEAPVVGHRTWLEQYTAIWSRLSFSWKMIVRNMARHKIRSGINVFGVVVSTSLLIIGFFSLDAMDYMMEYEYERTQRQDVRVGFFMERGKDALYESQRFDYVDYAEPLLQYPFTLTNGWRTKDVLVTGVPRHARLQRLMDIDENTVDVGEEGLVLSDKLAGMLSLKVGDTVQIKPMMGRVTDEKTVRVSKIVQQYFGASGFMNIEALSRVLNEPFVMNAVLLATEPGMDKRLNDELEDIAMVASIEVKSDTIRNMSNTIELNMKAMSIVTVLFAGIIAFSIIYNITSVSLAERQRELASLRVMGFERQEVGRILYFENILMGVIGIVLGIPTGILICFNLVSAFDTELIRLPFHLETKTFYISAGLTMGFVFLSNLAIRHKINSLDLVETLKERE
ncbi:MAG: FtsX-like permease family protein [Candidatus Hydrogenedentota bacterium]